MARVNILMADDHEREIRDARQMLVDMGHHVDTETTFFGALDLARTNTYEVAVIDLGWFTDQSPELKANRERLERGGFELAREVRKRNPDALLILYSNRVDTDEIFESSVREGMFCIRKSFNETSREALGAMVKVFVSGLQREAELKEEVSRLTRESDEGRQETGSVQPGSLRVGHLLRALTVPQLWGLIGALAAIAGVGFTLGRLLWDSG